MTHATEIYAYIWDAIRLPFAVTLAAVSGIVFLKVWQRHHEDLWQPQHAVRRITDADKRAEATRIEREVYANPWPARVTPLDHDAIRDMPLVAPRRYVGRVEVVFPDAVVADVVPVDWVHYLYDAADWRLEMLRGPTDEEPTGALVLAGTSS